VLHLKNGSNVAGKLKSCDEEQCFINSQRVPIDDIAIIELRHIAVPPAAKPRAVILNDGTIAKGNYVSLSLGEVDTDAGEIDRDDVALIVLQTIVAVPPPPPPPAQPAETPTKEGGTRGALWSGTIRARWWGTSGGVTTTVDVLVQVRLREYIFPWRAEERGGKVVGTFIRLRSENSVIDNTMRCKGEIACEGHGSVAITMREGDNNFPCIYSKERAGPTHPDVPVGKALYVIGVPPHGDSKYAVTYTTASGSSVSDTPFSSPMIGRQPSIAPGPLIDPYVRYIENGRMTGSYTAPAVGAFEHIAVSWMVCRDGVACPVAPPLP